MPRAEIKESIAGLLAAAFAGRGRKCGESLPPMTHGRRVADYGAACVR